MSYGVLGQSPGVLTGRLGASTVTRLNGMTATSVTTGGTSTFGSWALVNSSTSDEFYIVGFELSSVSSDTVMARVGVGASGSEVTIAEQMVVLVGSSVGFAPPIPLFAPPRVAAASRVTLAIAGPSSGSISLRLLVVPVANLEGH